jgi:ribosomal protein S18 acetylase RimI-like enzyme
MSIVVRRADLADAAIVAEFNRRLAEETEGKTLDAAILRAGVEAGLADENKGLYFVAEDDGAIVGQLMLTREWSDWRNGWMWWIQSVYVQKEARRRGIFRILYQHVYEAAKADPAVIGLRLYVEQANEAAQQTYERLGMSRIGYLLFQRYPL